MYRVVVVGCINDHLHKFNVISGNAGILINAFKFEFVCQFQFQFQFRLLAVSGFFSL